MRSKVGLVKIAILLAIVAVVLATVKWTSISGGPTADDAIVAIRVAQRDLFEAKKSQRSVETRAHNDAEAALNLALSLLEEKRYEDAIVAARKVTTVSREFQQ